MKELYELCDTIMDAIVEANETIRSGGGKLTAGDVDFVDKLTHSLKSVKAVIAMGDDGYARKHSWDSRGMVGELRELMRTAPDDRTRAEFQRFISKIETM